MKILTKIAIVLTIFGVLNAAYADCTKSINVLKELIQKKDITVGKWPFKKHYYADEMQKPGLQVMNNPHILSKLTNESQIQISEYKYKYFTGLTAFSQKTTLYCTYRIAISGYNKPFEFTVCLE